MSENTIVAFMDDPDEIKPNPIHSTSVAKDYGFDGALVGGATAYGWTVRTIVDALGLEWLDHGWVELRFKRPIYPGDALEVRVDDDGNLSVKNGDVLCFEGKVGLGDASWLHELQRPANGAVEPRANTLPRLTLASVPVNQDLAARSVAFSVEDAAVFAEQREREPLQCFYGENARVHPAWIAEQPIHWLHHSYDYGPSIHAQSRIQHLAPVLSGQTFVVARRCTDGYERNGHHYIVNDTELRSERGECVAQVRHTCVFQIAKRG